MASWVGVKSSVTPSQIDAVARAIRRTPIVDNHAHPLLRFESLGKHPLLSITTEASGDAIHAATSSLPHLRAVRQLATVLGCGFTWESVVAAIEQRRIDSFEDWAAQCLSGIETVLVDDGLDGDDAESYSWFDDYTRSGCKRIVRIEKLAADIINRLGKTCDASSQTGNDVIDDAYDEWIREFDAHINAAIEDPDVVAFKSVICYRSGLDILAADEDGAREAFGDIIANFSLLDFERLQEVSLNNLVVHRTATLIRDSAFRHKKPIQFHTGLGDNDITLSKSSPSHLQPFIRAYPTVPIVLLHASYPFTREAGYLASVYENVYADIGEVFPAVSQDGQERILRQILELCPWSKVIWSSDGHWFPETYLLANMQMREAFEVVLCEYVRKGHIGWKAAIELVRDMLFRTSNKLYRLGLEFSELEESSDIDLFYLTDAELFQNYLKNQERPDFIRICWNDFTAQPRMRMVPFRKFASLLEDGKSTDVGITKAVFSMIQNDWLMPGAVATGEYRLHPDFSSLKKGPIAGHVSMYADFREQSGAIVPLCPRSLLQRAVELGAENNLTFLLGFEIEFLLVERIDKASSSANANGINGTHTSRFTALTTDGHAWSVSRYFADPRISKLLHDIVATLEEMGIFVEQLHAESATGQFELILPPYPPIEAVDTLLHTRDVMNALATAAGFRITLHPKPFAQACGTAAHTHMSISSPSGSRPEVYESFYAGVLKHMRAIIAFTYSNPASFERLVDGAWAGGRWVTWGTQNRETALRKIEDSHWELKCMDGLANPYFAMAAVLFSGINGVLGREKMTWGDCEIDPANLTENDRKEMGVEKMLPGSIEEALAALKEDEELVEWMGSELVERYVALKEFEVTFLLRMGEEERRQWLMERY